MTSFGKFEIYREIGRGELSVAYEARDIATGQIVALKQYGIALSKLPGFPNHFRLKFQEIVKIRHQNIAEVYEFGFQNEIAFVAMELVTGESFKRVIKERRPLSLARKIQLMMDVCLALGAAHGNGVQHLDVRPADVLVTDGGKAKVFDFGMSDLSDLTTVTGAFVGMFPYMSPEMVQGKKRDSRSDIFAAGAMFYELLSYRKPFQGDNIAAAMFSIVSHPHSPLLQVVSDCPVELDIVINRMLSKAPEERQQRAEDVYRELKQLFERRGMANELSAEMPGAAPQPERLRESSEFAGETWQVRSTPSASATAPLLGVEHAASDSISDESYLEAIQERYQIFNELGRGAMGAVYRARDRETGDVVALKVILPKLLAQPEIVDHFKMEMILARKVTHKNVCRVHELLRFRETAVISMEFIEGQTLKQIVRLSGGVPVRRGIEWARQICSALVEAHSQGVIHRDLKPQNILVTREGTVKIMDFGLAAVAKSHDHKTLSIVGTPYYMSPEQALGRPVDARSDIYSLGLILYEMFTGQPAIAPSPAVQNVLQKQIYHNPVSPRILEPFLPKFLDTAIMRCIEKNPESRFQSAAELGDYLTAKGSKRPPKAKATASAEGRS
jgi:serine/threonine protein kinase